MQMKLLLVLLFAALCTACESTPTAPSNVSEVLDVLGGGGTGGTTTITIIISDDHDDDHHGHPEDDTPQPNQAPVLVNPGSQTSDTGARVSLPITASDPDRDTLRYSASGLPRGLQIDPDTGVIAGTITSSSFEDSPFSVALLVSDGTLSDSTVFQWVVTEASS